MDVNLSQSSCEIIQEIKNLEVCSESEHFSSQFSDNVEKLEVAGDSSQAMSVEEPAKVESSTQEESTSTSGESGSTSSSDEPAPMDRKRKRKRKRRRKAKAHTTAYSPPTPFMSRYKKIKLCQPVVVPKLHIRFDDTGEPDISASEFNVKPRIIAALLRNFIIHENLKESMKENSQEEEVAPVVAPCTPEIIVSLKPRVIKGIRN